MQDFGNAVVNAYEQIKVTNDANAYKAVQNMNKNSK